MCHMLTTQTHTRFDSQTRILRRPLSYIHSHNTQTIHEGKMISVLLVECGWSLLCAQWHFNSQQSFSFYCNHPVPSFSLSLSFLYPSLPLLLHVSMSHALGRWATQNHIVLTSSTRTQTPNWARAQQLPNSPSFSSSYCPSELQKGKLEWGTHLMATVHLTNTWMPAAETENLITCDRLCAILWFSSEAVKNVGGLKNASLCCHIVVCLWLNPYHDLLDRLQV